MTEAKNVHEAIINVMREVGYVKKQSSPNLSYTFAGEVALIAALRPAMLEQGLYLRVTGITQYDAGEYTTKSGSVMNDVRLAITGQMVHAPSGTFIDVAAVGEGSDSSDKASNKASTAAYKYLLRQTFMIETGDDPDYVREERASEAELKRLAQQIQRKATGNNGSQAPTKTAQVTDEAQVQVPKEPAKNVHASYPPGSKPVERISYETACKVKNKDGVEYGSIDSETLASMVGGINKGLKKQGVTQEQMDEYLMKKDAIAVILQTRAAQAN